MFAITAVTGHVGGATARHLLAAGADVRVVVRDPARGPEWTEVGADVALADYRDHDALTAALDQCRGAFVMLPTLPSASDADHRGLAESIVAAVADSGVRHVVALSSVGADLAEGTGPIRWLHHLENRLSETGAVVSVVRSPHFQEKVEVVLPAATGAGIYPVFGERADLPIPMVATRDIGEAAAELLLAQPASSEVIDLEAPAYSERDVAETLGTVLGRPLEVVTIPRAGWLGALSDAGVEPPLAAALVELFTAEADGLLQPRGDRRRRCSTPLVDTLREVVRVASGRVDPSSAETAVR